MTENAVRQTGLKDARPSILPSGRAERVVDTVRFELT